MSRNFVADKLKIQGKQTLSAIALILILTISGIMATTQIANAHTPPLTNVPTWAYLVLSPNPIGVGQTLVVYFWLNWVPPGAGGLGGARWTHLTVDVTAPDGTKTTLGPFISDDVGGGHTYYVPTQLGKYTFTFVFPGETTSLYGPTGIIASANAIALGANAGGGDYINDTFAPSSTTETLTVQQTKAAEPPNYPLPTLYWTRPIEGQNTAWVSIASNWLGGSGPTAVHNIQPDGIAPNSPHIMWTKPMEDGGIAGVDYPGSQVAYWHGENYESRFNYPIIMGGRLYYDLPLGSHANYGSSPEGGEFSGGWVGGGYICVDLRTGQTIWWQNWTTVAQTPLWGQLYTPGVFDQHGVLPNGILWCVQGSTWSAFDSLTGTWLYNLTGCPTTNTAPTVAVPGYQLVSAWAQQYGPSGEILKYVLGYDTTSSKGWLALWNNSAAPDLVNGLNGTNQQMWRPNGKVIDASKAYTWNVTIPSLAPNVGGVPTIRYVNYDDMLLGTFGTVTLDTFIQSTNPVWTVFAISLKPDTRGQLLWEKNYSTVNNETLEWGLQDPTTRVFTLAYQQTMQWMGYSMDNGNLLWGPVGNETAMNYYTYGGIDFYNAGAQIMYNGILYSAGMGGRIYAWNDLTGTLLWTYTADQTFVGDPWPNYPIYISPIADGKIYTFTFQHTATTPLYKGAKIYCINATTGQQIWNLMGWPSSITHSEAGGIVADGYFAYYNIYDSQVYSVGKGPSATTVSAPDTAVPLGNQVLIQGTVMDTAAGTKENQQAADFPNGVPAVSDDSMGAWMEFVYMQKPMPTDATGVPVTLTAFDPNKNIEVIGTVTSDASGNYAVDWTPPVPGIYKITATFYGTNSYFSSTAETALDVSKAPAAQVSITTPAGTPPPTAMPTSTPATSSPQVTVTPIPPPSNAGVPTTYIIIAVVAIIIVVAAAALALRRRK